MAAAKSRSKTQKRRARRKRKVLRAVDRPYPLKLEPIFCCDSQMQPDGTHTVRVLLGGIPPEDARTVALWLGGVISSRLPKKVQAKVVEAEPARLQ